MHRTIFTTPIVNSFLKGFSLLYIRLAGWKVIGKLPANANRAVIIAAPHTSNWDLPLTLMVSFALNLRIYWMGKESIFKPPFRGIMMWLGGISVDRSKSNNLVADSAQALKDSTTPMQLMIPPEGTRSKARYWKTGFYYIALGANVPILLAFMDYEKKEMGIGGTFEPTGDIEKDMLTVKAFYANVKGKNADQFGTS